MTAAPRRLWKFPGGLRLDKHTEQSTQSKITILPAPSRIFLPLSHNSLVLRPWVNIGEQVGKGQALAGSDDARATGIHASISGVITGIQECPIPHPSGLPGLCIVVESDGEDRWWDDLPPSIENYEACSRAELIARIRDCGVAGMGGAAFDTAFKLDQRTPIETLIINGVECEPYLSCDDLLMRERALEILSGARLLCYLTGAKHCLLVIEDNMPNAIQAVIEAQKTFGEEIELVKVPAIYPAGGERQLVQVLTGIETPSGLYPTDTGVLCQNVGTVAAIYKAVVLGQPVISRIVTVTGAGVAQPGNLEVRIGTPINELIAACGGYKNGAERLIMGGPMMGVALANDDAPVIKASNCVLVLGKDELTQKGQQQACIRCGECVRVCPAQLLPQQLYFSIYARDFERAAELALADCIECGCCAYVCPSRIPLVSYYRFAKDEVARLDVAKGFATESKIRFEQKRVREQAVPDAETHVAKKPTTDPTRTKEEIAAALKRAKEKSGRP